MTEVYSPSIKSVRVTEWHDDEEDEDQPTVEFDNAEVEEVYYESYSGTLHVSVITDDRGIYIDIPIVAVDSWNEFVESLPMWE